jgi:phosphoribosyl-AMP cyclohydrolase
MTESQDNLVLDSTQGYNTNSKSSDSYFSESSRSNANELEYVKLLDEKTPSVFDIETFEFDESILKKLKFNEDGLIPAIVQDRKSRHVLMMAWMDLSAVKRTIQTGRTWFYSRSRKAYWQKGETSGDRQYLRGIYYDCDEDVILLVVDQQGKGACHTGNWSCFYRELGLKI